MQDALLAVLRGGRNGISYGVKIRFPHALVMTFMFADGSLQEKLRKIIKLTYTHARNLCVYVTLYKAMLVAMRSVTASKNPIHSGIAGAIGGYIVFGENSPINQQINLYLLSRIIYGGVKAATNQQVIPVEKGSFLDKHSFSIFAAFVWAVVMWLFELDHKALQPSLQKSMQFLYWKSDDPTASWRP